jgi:hypothetical protein
MLNGFDLTAEDLVAGQDPKGLAMCFFKFSDRVRIRSIRVDGREYRGGRLVAPPIDPETACTAEEMAEIPVRRPITRKVARLTSPAWADPNQKLDAEVA